MTKDLFCRNCGERFEEGAKFCQKCGAQREETSIERAKMEPLIRKEEGVSSREEIRDQLNPTPKKTVDEALKQRREQWRNRVVPMSHPEPNQENSPEEIQVETKIEPPMPSEPVFVEEYSAKKRSKMPIFIALFVIAAGLVTFFLWKGGAFTKKPSEPTVVSQGSTEESQTSTGNDSEKGGENSLQGETGNAEGEGVKIDPSSVYDPSKNGVDSSGDAEASNDGGEATATEYPSGAANENTNETPMPEGDPSSMPMGEGTYLLPESATRRLTEADLEGMTQQQLRLARNEIYARHGRKFSNKELQAYFADQAWYRPTIEGRNFDEKKILNKIEQANLEVIINYEKKMGYRNE